VKIGLVIANTGTTAVDNVRVWPARAEEMGFSSVWFTDHVIGLKAYAPRFGPIWMELLTSLAYAAGQTSRIRLGSGVMVVPYRDPVYTAKVLATIDQLCAGRLNVGVGVGWSRSEYKALGVGDLFERRGAYTDEALDVMFRCWEGGKLGYDGEWVKFREIEFWPTPVQRPRPEIWVGGHSKAALRRAARFADVWHPMALPLDQFAAATQLLDELSDGRPIRRTTRILAGATVAINELTDQIHGFAGLGCEEIAVDLETDNAAEFRAAAERLAEAMSLTPTP
jgi:probable F420-dependent oxidoreductase